MDASIVSQASPNITTSFLLSNLHCPSCVCHITDILSALDPPPISISPWLASSWVTVEHDKSLSVEAIREALEDGGFDVCGISPDDVLKSQIGPGETGYLDRFVDKLSSGNHGRKPSHSNIHLDNCQLCREEAKAKDASASAVPVLIISTPAHGSKSSQSPHPLSNDVMDSDKELSIVVDSIDLQDAWRASLAVGGMTCAACVVNITDSLGKIPWITSVTVNLIGNSASIDFLGGHHKDELVGLIEDLGYEATIDTVTSVLDIEQASSKRKVSRTVEIKVGGMYCNHCPSRILSSFEAFDDRINIEKSPTVQDPIMRISYTPEVPYFTIRHIISAISDVDPALVPTIYHPPTLEERSRKIHARERKRILIRVIFTLIISIPTLAIGIVLMSLVPQTNPGRKYFMKPSAWRVSRTQWALFALATPIWVLCADVFHIRAMKEIRALWRPGSTTPILRRFYRFGSMNMLMSLGTSIAYLSSVAQLIAAGAHPSAMGPHDDSFYFDSVVFLTLFLLIGRLIEAYSKSKTGDAVTMLGKLRPTEALLIEPGSSDDTPGVARQEVTRLVPVDFLEFEDLVRIPNGGSPPCDGTVTQGKTKFDESSLTGESKLIKKDIGDEVFSGTVNKESPILIKITGVAGSSMLDQIVKAVREGQTRRAPVERVADSLTAYFVPFVTLLAISTWIVWLALGYSGTLPAQYLGHYSGSWVAWSLQFAIAVVVVACPCGLALAAPTALFVGGGLAAQHGILVKGGGEAFERASKLDCIVFDKTGTLTCGGEPVVTDSQVFSIGAGKNLPSVNGSEDSILGLIGSIEGQSTHTIAKAVATFCSKSTGPSHSVNEIEETAGKGMKGKVHTDEADVEVIIGNESLMEDYGVEIPSNVQGQLEQWKSEGKSVALAAISNQLIAIFAISDPIRPEAPAIIAALQKRGTDVWMLSGDNKTTATAVGIKVGISSSNIIADVLPSQKADTIRYLQRSLKARTSGAEHSQKRAIVAMVGDGINDSPALTAADIGIAIGSGSDIAISSAMFVLVSSNLNSLITLLDLSKIVFRRIKFNFAWALVYNMIALPVAAGVLFPIVSNGAHVRLAPVWASLAMAASSVSVVLSSLALRSGVPWLGFRASKAIGNEVEEGTE